MIRNLTGRDIIINGITYPTDPVYIKEPIRNLIVTTEIEGIVIRKLKYSSVEALPSVVEGTYLIVHPGVALANPTRTDLLYPDYGSLAKRDSRGVVISLGSLVQP